jgi:hypothetical protein
LGLPFLCTVLITKWGVPSSPRIKIRSGAVKSKRMICCKHSWRGGDPCVCNYKEWFVWKKFWYLHDSFSTLVR